jgi:DNA-binding SARP family transcriptional activator
MRVRLLGPVDVMVDGEERPVAGLRRKAVLATLALHAGEVVSTDRLVDAVWGETAPLTALNTLQHHVSHLRAVLGGRAVILARPPGYLLDLGEDGTDVQLAERLLRQGTQSADPRQGAQELRQALALWRRSPILPRRCVMPARCSIPSGVTMRLPMSERCSPGPIMR